MLTSSYNMSLLAKKHCHSCILIIYKSANKLEKTVPENKQFSLKTNPNREMINNFSLCKAV